MSSRIALYLFSIIVLSLGFAVGCSDDDDNEESHHLEAVGVRVLLDDVIVVEADGTTVTGEFNLTTNVSPGTFSVMFLDPDSGEWYDPEDRHEEGEESHDHELVVEAVDADLVDVFTAENSSDLDHWEFILEGKTAGNTKIVVQIYHNDHPDYVSPDFDVTIID